jgi:hypothetical protein
MQTLQLVASPSQPRRREQEESPLLDGESVQADMPSQAEHASQAYAGHRLDDANVSEGSPGEPHIHRTRAISCPDYAQSTARAVMTTPRVITRFTADPAVMSFRSLRYQAFAPGGMGVGGLLLMGLAG